jgi:hypothetical protein
MSGFGSDVKLAQRWRARAAQIPKPRINLVLYAGVLAPHAKLREKVVGYARPKPMPEAPATETQTRAERETWSELMPRTFGLDVLACPRCDGRLKHVATILDERVARRILDRVKMPARAHCGWFNFKGSNRQKRVKYLSGGERNRVHLAKVLKSGGNVLLLDEPTNDLDVETLRSLEAALDDFAGCAPLISHDRWLLDRIATHILAFDGDRGCAAACRSSASSARRSRSAEDAHPQQIRALPIGHTL